MPHLMSSIYLFLEYIKGFSSRSVIQIHFKSTVEISLIQNRFNEFYHNFHFELLYLFNNKHSLL